MSALEAAAQVLAEAGTPLRAEDLTQQMLAKGLWQTSGKTPAATVNARISVDIQRFGAASRFMRVGKSTYALRSAPSTDGTAPAPVTAPGTPPATAPVASGSPPALTFLDAAEKVLSERTNKKPVHYRELTQTALSRGFLVSTGATPEATMYAQILTDISRRKLRGDPQRFVKQGRGRVGLAAWSPSGLDAQIEQHNRAVRAALLTHVKTMPPTKFEELIGTLLGKLGFESVTVTKPSADGGIDVRGTLVVADAIRVNMAVQAKRWKANVLAPVVQQVRGSLGVHEHGLIITSSDFSAGAVQEASAPGKTPIGLMNGEQLVVLLVEHEILVERAPQELLQLRLEAPDAD